MIDTHLIRWWMGLGCVQPRVRWGGVGWGVCYQDRYPNFCVTPTHDSLPIMAAWGITDLDDNN